MRSKVKNIKTECGLAKRDMSKERDGERDGERDRKLEAIEKIMQEILILTDDDEYPELAQEARSVHTMVLTIRQSDPPSIT
jgi:hypothetical protein